jgi:hypothetical protein
MRNLLTVVVIVCFSVGFNQVSAQSTKVIYFLAGLKDHAGPEGSGRHDHRRDLLVLQHCIDSATNIKGVNINTKFLYDRKALDIEDLKDCAALIVECSAVSSSQKRVHPLIPPLPDGETEYDEATLAYLGQIDSLQEAGMGIMIIHWGTRTDGASLAVRNHYWQWFGVVSMEKYSQNPLGWWKISLIEAAKQHPILRGVNPWNYKDEIMSRFVVNPGDPYRTDLLMGESPAANQSEDGSPKGVISPRCVASAYEKGKQRGVLWGGMDYHSQLLNENYRRFLLNEIVWTAGIEVPKGGVKTAAKQLQLSPVTHDRFDDMKPDDFIVK